MHTGKEQIRKPHKNDYGYLQVGLWKNGKQEQHFVHRLTASAFIPNPYDLPQVNHKDENPSNNVVDNLEWISHKDNINYGTAMKRMLQHRTGPKKEKPVICIETGKIYPSGMEASRKTGANFRHISECCRGKLKTTGGYHWRYAN